MRVGVHVVIIPIVRSRTGLKRAAAAAAAVAAAAAPAAVMSATALTAHQGVGEAGGHVWGIGSG